MSDVTGRRYRTLYAGSAGLLGVMIGVAKRVAPQAQETFPAWQGMQYMRDMFSGQGKVEPLDNERYPDVRWTPVRAQPAARFGRA